MPLKVASRFSPAHSIFSMKDTGIHKVATILCLALSAGIFDHVAAAIQQFCYLSQLDKSAKIGSLLATATIRLRVISTQAPRREMLGLLVSSGVDITGPMYLQLQWKNDPLNSRTRPMILRTKAKCHQDQVERVSAIKFLLKYGPDPNEVFSQKLTSWPVRSMSSPFSKKPAKR